VAYCEIIVDKRDLMSRSSVVIDKEIIGVPHNSKYYNTVRLFILELLLWPGFTNGY
jgi:hypothetical protein